jgi:hypothetical protein
MPAPAPSPRHAGFAAGMWRFPRSLVHPIVLTFVLAAVFSYLSADTVRAAYLLAVGLALAWDHARPRASRPPSGPAAATESRPGASHAIAVFSIESAERRRAAMRRLLVPALLAAVAYSLIVGWFARYSWPATISVTIPSVAGVLVAWRVSAGSHTEPGRLSWVGVGAWAFVWAGASVWELTALFLQPSLSTDSYAHPTLSVLANSVLAAWPGRSVVLFGWLAFGWYLARR